MNKPTKGRTARQVTGPGSESLVCGFVGISGRDDPHVVLFPATTAAKLDPVYVHGAGLGLMPRALRGCP
jgi:hypothetical protein